MRAVWLWRPSPPWLSELVWLIQRARQMSSSLPLHIRVLSQLFCRRGSSLVEGRRLLCSPDRISRQAPLGLPYPDMSRTPQLRYFRAMPALGTRSFPQPVRLTGWLWLLSLSAPSSVLGLMFWLRLFQFLKIFVDICFIMEFC